MRMTVFRHGWTAVACALLVLHRPLAVQARPSAADGEWEAIGPEGGSIARVLQHPGNGSILFALTENYPGTVYKSEDTGVTWSLLARLQASLIDFAVHPADGSRLYLIDYRSAYYSDDGGSSWSRHNFSDRTFLCLAPDPDGSGKVHAAGARYDNSSGTVTYLTSYYASSDNCRTFSAVQVSDEYFYPHAVAVDPSNPNCMYIAGRNGDYQGRVMRSLDGGASWTDISGAAMTSIIYDLAVGPEDGRLYALSYSKLYFSTDQGDTWDQSSAWAGGTELNLDPNHAGHLYIGRHGTVHKSTDGGQSFSSLGDGIAPVECRNIVIDHSNASNLVMATAAGVVRSTDGGITWNPCNTGIYAVTITSLQSDPLSPGVLYAGTQQSGLFTTAGGAGKASVAGPLNWVPVEQFAGEYITSVAFLPSRPDALYVTMQYG